EHSGVDVEPQRANGGGRSAAIHPSVGRTKIRADRDYLVGNFRRFFGWHHAAHFRPPQCIVNSTHGFSPARRVWRFRSYLCAVAKVVVVGRSRSEEHTSELQSLTNL